MRPGQRRPVATSCSTARTRTSPPRCRRTLTSSSCSGSTPGCAARTPAWRTRGRRCTTTTSDRALRRERRIPDRRCAARTFYLSGVRSRSALSRNDGTLSTAKPTSGSGSDQVSWLPVGSSICDRSLDQWAMGAFTLVTSRFPRPVPCFADDRLGQIGPTRADVHDGAVHPRPHAGRADRRDDLRARQPGRDEWVVNIEDVAPDARPSRSPGGAAGFGPGSRSITHVAGRRKDRAAVPPVHQGCASPVVRGALTRYDIEVFPTYATLAPGHRLRVTINTTDFPHLLPTPLQLTKVVRRQLPGARTATAPSSITVPLTG